MSSNTTNEKKKPGRPRKKPLKKPIKRNGIVSTPLNDDNYIEMIYDMPSVLKKIFTLFRSMAVKGICIEFKNDVMNILAVDHLKKSHIKVTIHCDKVNHYYCKEETVCHLNPKNIEKIIQSLDKNYITIAFVIKTITNRSVLNIIFKNDIKIDEYKEIDFIQPSNNYNNITFEDFDYPIKFTLPYKYFKKLINDISLFSDIMTINKVGKTALTFTYTSKDKTVKSKHIVQSPDKINLKSSICDDEIFSSSIQIDYIKPLSSSLISDNIDVSADNYRNMIFKTNVDNNTIKIIVNTSTVKLN
jgi:hypothetical protein